MEIRRRPPNPSVKVANLEYAIPHDDSEPRNILEKIIWEKGLEVELSRQKVALDVLKSQIAELPPTKNFICALRDAPILPAVIAEIKKASPSKGIIREDFDPIYIANSYQKSGASCISVLTDKKFFQGGFDILMKVRKAVNLPLLCKDFIFTAYQIYEARAAGADAILLIAAVLSDQDLNYLNKVALSLGLAVLVEVHDENEIERVLKVGGFSLVGINNRNLKTFETDIITTEILVNKFQDRLINNDILLVSESGIFNRSDLDKVYKFGAKAVLVGEALMIEDDVSKGLTKLIRG